MAKKFVVVQLAFDPEIETELESLVARRGVTRIGVMSRLVMWFSRQDEWTQAMILGLISEQKPNETTVTVLTALAARTGPEPSTRARHKG